MIIIKLDEFLKSKGISQREFAKLSGIRRPTISEMCLNKSKSLPVENLNLICKVLDCDLTDIISFIKDNPDC
jgi:putative transcriptional regulator